MRTIDCHKLDCPAPILKAKELIEKEGLSEIELLVDNEAAKENVSIFLESRGFETFEKKSANGFSVTGKKQTGICKPVLGKEFPAPLKYQTIIIVTSDQIGQDDNELGSKLMKNFLATLKEMVPSLWRIVFVNNGVKLTIDSSESLPDIRDLANIGVSILVCGTCLSHFDLLDRKRVGETTNMLDIVTSMQMADKIIHM